MVVADKIEKRVTLRAPVSRVWRANTDAQEFGRWFGFTLEGAFVRQERRLLHGGAHRAGTPLQLPLDPVRHRRGGRPRERADDGAAQAENLKQHVEGK